MKLGNGKSSKWPNGKINIHTGNWRRFVRLFTLSSKPTPTPASFLPARFRAGVLARGASAPRSNRLNHHETPSSAGPPAGFLCFLHREGAKTQRNADCFIVFLRPLVFWRLGGEKMHDQRLYSARHPSPVTNNIFTSCCFSQKKSLTLCRILRNIRLTL